MPLKSPASEPRDPPLSVVARGTSPQRTDPKNHQLRSFRNGPDKNFFFFSFPHRSGISLASSPRPRASSSCRTCYCSCVICVPAVLSSTNHPISDEPPDSKRQPWRPETETETETETLSDAPDQIFPRSIAGYAVRPQSCCALPSIFTSLLCWQLPVSAGL